MNVRPVDRLIRTPVTRIEPIPPYAKHTYVDNPDRQPYGGGLPLYALMPLKQALEHAMAWLIQSQELRKSAASLSNLRTSVLRKPPADPHRTMPLLEAFLEQANNLQAVYKACESSLAPFLFSIIHDPLEQAASWRTGLFQPASGGEWQLDQQQMLASSEKDPSSLYRFWYGPDGIVRRILQQIDEVTDRPFYELLRPSAAATHFRQYHYTDSLYASPALWKGLLVNRTI